MTDQELLDLAARCGFDHVGPMNVEVMRFEPAVRDMCAADRCRSYGRCWTCPPGCGTLEEISARAGQPTVGGCCSSPPDRWKTISMWRP